MVVHDRSRRRAILKLHTSSTTSTTYGSHLETKLQFVMISSSLPGIQQRTQAKTQKVNLGRGNRCRLSAAPRTGREAVAPCWSQRASTSTSTTTTSGGGGGEGSGRSDHRDRRTDYRGAPARDGADGGTGTGTGGRGGIVSQVELLQAAQRRLCHRCLMCGVFLCSLVVVVFVIMLSSSLRGGRWWLVLLWKMVRKRKPVLRLIMQGRSDTRMGIRKKLLMVRE